MVHKAQHLVKVLQMRLQADGFNHGGNSVVKRAQVGVVLGWVTSRKVSVLHLCEHHLDPMSAKCSIYSHERCIHVWITNDTWVNEFDSKITQLNPKSNITIWLAVEIILYLSVDDLKGLSNEWFIRHNTWWRFFKWGCKWMGLTEETL